MFELGLTFAFCQSNYNRASDVCMYVSHVLDRKLLERLMSPSPKIGYVRVCILMNRLFFSNFWYSYFSSYGEFGEFSLRLTAALSGRCVSKKAGHYIILK